MDKNSFSNQTNSSSSSHLDLSWLKEEIQVARQQLLNHPIYTQVKSIADLRLFMQSHVFAVWDFMTLLKSLQKNLTSVQVPWIPSKNSENVRFINETVLVEESDDIFGDTYLSHFEIYLKAMEEVGANTQAIEQFIEDIRLDLSVADALEPLAIPQSTKNFVITTVDMAQGSSVQVASSFLYGREDIIPDMFQSLLDHLAKERQLHCPYLQLYLQRHIEIDRDDHGPMGEKLLSNLCGSSPQLWQQALDSAQKAIRLRQSLWDGILSEMSPKATYHQRKLPEEQL